MTRQLLIFFAAYSILQTSAFAQENGRKIHVGHFSSEKLSSITPAGWSPLTFDGIDKHTAYFLVRDNNKVVFKAVSHASASGFIRKISVDPSQYPVLSWRWKINKLVEKADITTRQGDDYPARIYITFDYDHSRLSGWESFKIELYKSVHGEYPPLAVLNYVWDNKHPVGFSTANAYTDRVQMLVAQSGKKHIGNWVEQKVNVYDDYKRVFGEVPLTITGVAIMTDTDNTKDSATAYYGDIQFHRK